MVKKLTYSRRDPEKRQAPYDYDSVRENGNSRKMGNKLTYSRRYPGKRQAPYDFDSIRENDNSCKRPRTLDPLQQGKGSSVSKRGLFSGPVSIPDDTDSLPLPKSGNKHSVFDKVLSNGTCQPPKPDEDRMRSDRQLFAEIAKIGQKPRELNTQKSKRYLPTPPAEVQKNGYQEDEDLLPLNGHADMGKLMTPKTSSTPSTRTSQLFERVIKSVTPKEPYQPRAYMAVETAAPRRTIDGSPLSRKSRENQLWIANQASSPLLQLPQNVRELIYQYTLGGKTINIEYETYRITTEPTRPKVARQVVPIFKYHCTVLDGKKSPYQIAAKPWIKTYKTLTLLNSVCRQLYVETAALPYKLNTMCFGSHHIMVNFLLMEKRLSRGQLDAFTELLLPDELPGSNLLALLRNVEKVHLSYGDKETPSGWYHVVREEGEEPRLTLGLKRHA